MNLSTDNFRQLLKDIPMKSGAAVLPSTEAGTGERSVAASSLIPYRGGPLERQNPWRVTLFLSNLATDGGAEVQTIKLARGLKSRGWNVSVLSIQRAKSGTQALISDDIPVHSLEASGSNPIRDVIGLAKFLKRERPDILHCHMSRAVLTARIARLLHQVPVVIGTLHGLKMYNARGTGWWLRERANGLTDRMSDLNTVVCRAAADHYLSTGAVSHRSLRVVPNAVDTEEFHYDPWTRECMRSQLGLEDNFVWLIVGRFQPVKDHHTLIRAFARVSAASPRSVLLLAGSGPLQTELQDLVKGLGIESKVRFLGLRSDIPALMNAADACVLSSTQEAMPMTLLEAAATGLPAVTTDVGGTSEITQHEVTGFLVPPSNPVALADAMLRLSELSPATRSRMGEQARRQVTASFGLDHVLGQWEQVYREMLVRNRVQARAHTRRPNGEQ
jgi:glycosyltransferase involved in cell wall biosynthesis